MNSSIVKSVALFFYFALMDEKLAQDAATIAVRRLRKSLENNKNNENKNIEKLIVFHCHQVRSSIGNKRRFLWAGSKLESGWAIPRDTDLGPWREFTAENDDDVIEAVIFSKILKFSEHSIALGLGITVGTLKYRLGNGIRILGNVVQPGVMPL